MAIRAHDAHRDSRGLDLVEAVIEVIDTRELLVEAAANPPSVRTTARSRPRKRAS